MSEFTIRASSFAELYDCAYRWEGKHLLGIKKPTGLRAVLGTALHASTAAFDTGRIDGSNVSVDDAAGLLSDKLHHPDEEVNLNQDDITLREAEEVGLALHTKYCLDVSPNYQFKAVEMATTPLDIDCGNGITIKLTGTMDRARIKVGSAGVGIADLKSGSTAVQKGEAKTKGHKAQIGTYELLYEHTTGELITDAAEIIGLKTKGKAEVATGTIIGGKQLMIGTEDTPGLIEIAAQMFRAGLFPPNPSSTICGEKYCPRWDTCPYHY